MLTQLNRILMKAIHGENSDGNLSMDEMASFDQVLQHDQSLPLGQSFNLNQDSLFVEQPNLGGALDTLNSENPFATIKQQPVQANKQEDLRVRAYREFQKVLEEGNPIILVREDGAS